MKSFTKLMKGLHDELNSVEGARFYHYRRPSNVKSEYGVWAEDGENNSFHSDNGKAEQQIHGTVDYYTLDEFNPVIDAIQQALENVTPGGWFLSSVQYEDDTNLIHYEWDFEVV